MGGNLQIRTLGAGNIVRAILAGTRLGGKIPAADIGVYARREEARQEYRALGHQAFDSVADAAKGASILVMAVLPNAVGSVTDELRDCLEEQTVVISVVLGASCSWYEQRLGGSPKIVRCMPSLTAQVGEGVYAVSRGANLTDEDFALAKGFLEASGAVVEIAEDKMAAVVPINGSSPGYFYHIANVFVQEAVKVGFEKEQALRLFAHTMKGSAETLLSSGFSPEKLDQIMRLPGGSTIASLEKMEDLGLDEALCAGFQACIDKSKEMEGRI